MFFTFNIRTYNFTKIQIYSFPSKFYPHYMLIDIILIFFIILSHGNSVIFKKMIKYVRLLQSLPLIFV